MRKILFIFLFFLMFINLSSQGVTTQVNPTAYLDNMLQIAETDLICSYFIARKIDEGIRFIGAQKMDLGVISYSDEDELFINKGSKDGYKEGDMFSIIAKGQKIRNPLTRKRLGTYFIKKGLAKITCIFEDKAVVTLRDCCYPVEITDFALPFKKEDTIRKKCIDYKRCVLPRSPVEGNVVYSNLFMEIAKENIGPETYITIDIGKAFVSKGDYVLFYKNFKRGLPPLIMGSGIVINAQNTNSTVRVIENVDPLGIGTKVVLMPELEEERRIEKEEDVPIIDTLEDLEEKPAEEKTLELNILFGLDEKTLDPLQRSEIEKIKEFIGSKSQYRIIMRGYSCSIGGLEYNLKLSQERVENIKDILVKEFDINEDFIETYYYGEKDAPFDNTSEEQRRKNRAVNIQVIVK